MWKSPCGQEVENFLNCEHCGNCGKLFTVIHKLIHRDFCLY